MKTVPKTLAFANLSVYKYYRTFKDVHRGVLLGLKIFVYIVTSVKS
jgi:hypothetical protein